MQPKPTPKKSNAVKMQETIKQKPKATILPKATKSSKPKGLNDFLKSGKTPPSKNKKGIPSDADVVIKGYNDKKTLSKSKIK